MRTFLANKLALIGAAITGFVLLAVVVGPWFSPYSPTEADFLALLAPPSLAHPFGTDSFGRDVLTRILYGARVSLAVSVAGVLAAALLGGSAGLVSAYAGGWSVRRADADRRPAVLLSELRARAVPDGGARLRRHQYRSFHRADLFPAVCPPRPQHGAGGQGGAVGAGRAADGPVDLQHPRAARSCRISRRRCSSRSRSASRSAS